MNWEFLFFTKVSKTAEVYRTMIDKSPWMFKRAGSKLPENFLTKEWAMALMDKFVILNHEEFVMIFVTETTPCSARICA
jgi:hypothetical protein